MNFNVLNSILGRAQKKEEIMDQIRKNRDGSRRAEQEPLFSAKLKKITDPSRKRDVSSHNMLFSSNYSNLNQRCPLNHKCIEYCEGRETTLCEYISQNQIECDICDESMVNKPCFYSCAMCDYDICGHCAANIAEIKANTLPKKVKFVDSDGDKVKIYQKHGVLVQSVNGRIDVEHLKKFSINTRTRKYKDEGGWGMIPADVDIHQLKRDVIGIMKPKYPTAVHNPNWVFLQKTTMANIIATTLGEACSFDLACTIASFVVERKINVRFVCFGAQSKNLMQNGTITAGAQEVVRDVLRMNCRGPLKKYYVIQLEDGESFEPESYWGDFKKQYDIQTLDEEMLMGDICCWNNVVLIASAALPKRRRMGTRGR